MKLINQSIVKKERKGKEKKRTNIDHIICDWQTLSLSAALRYITWLVIYYL